MAVKTGYSGITIRDLTDDQLRQWFWFNSDGSGTIPAGAYVLSQPVEDFKESPTGIANLYMQSGVVKLQNGLIPYAILNGNGLTLEKGGIIAGTPGQGGFIYLSTENYPNSYSINGSIGITDWKQIVGTNFGVRSDGTLYASEVNVAGAITAGEGSNVGSWVINDVSIHSEGKDNYDTDVEGIYIGQYNDLELQRKIYTISGGHARYEISADTEIGYVLTEDIIVKSGKKYYKKGWYVLTEDTVVDPEKTYYELEDDQYIEVVPQEGDNPSENEWYEFSTEVDVYTEVTPQEGDNPYQNKWYEEKKYYEKVDHYILTQDTIVKNWKIYYKKENDDYIEIEPVGDENPSEQGWYEFEEYRLVIPVGNENPNAQGWYENIGPMWHINSDGSADFSTLSVSQDGILTVPAASISGALTAAQIEVEDLSAITANIGSTINSEMASNSLKINYENIYLLSTDTRVHPDKEYYQNIVVEERIENPTGSPKENGYYEVAEYFITPDEIIDATTTYYSKTNNIYTEILEDDYYFESEDSEVSPEKTYYEKIDNTWTEVSPQEGDNPSEEGWYEQKSPIKEGWYEQYPTTQYVPSQDESVLLGKEYFDLQERFALIDPIPPNVNPVEEGYYEWVSESFINLTTEKEDYRLTNDTELLDKDYYAYKTEYYNTSDTEPNGNKKYYENIGIDEQGDFIFQQVLLVEETDNPSENGWYEKLASYEIIKDFSIYIDPDHPDDPINPMEHNFYINEGESSAEINLRKGNITITSNDKTVFAVNSEEEDDINVSDMEILERIKFGNLELVPYENGLVIKVGGRE